MTAQDPTAVLTILGSGTLVPDGDRHSAAHHLGFGARAGLLLDCGPGTLHGFARYGVAWQELTHVAISHFHNDHVGDLAALLFAFAHGASPKRAEPLTLLGPRGFSGFLARLADAMGDHVSSPGFELHVEEMEPGRPYEASGHVFRLTCHATPHTPESLAYRVEGAWGPVGYTGDTGPSEDVASFLGGCDVLVAECTLPDAAAVQTHLSPTTLAAMARRARPRVLAVVHVGPLQAPEDAAHGLAGVGGTVVAARDGMRISLGPTGPVVEPNPGAL